VRGVKSWLLLGGSSQCTSAGSKEEIKFVEFGVWRGKGGGGGCYIFRGGDAMFM